MLSQATLGPGVCSNWCAPSPQLVRWPLRRKSKLQHEANRLLRPRACGGVPALLLMPVGTKTIRASAPRNLGRLMKLSSLNRRTPSG